MSEDLRELEHSEARPEVALHSTPRGHDVETIATDVDISAAPAPVLARGIRRVLLIAAGILCIGMAYLGAILPGLPTTPWVLLAGECFRRSSPRLQRWLRRSPIFGRLIRDWEDHRGIRLPVKVFAIGMIVTVVTISILSGRLPVWVRWVIGSCALCGIGTILFAVRTVRIATHASHDSESGPR